MSRRTWTGEEEMASVVTKTRLENIECESEMSKALTAWWRRREVTVLVLTYLSGLSLAGPLDCTDVGESAMVEATLKRNQRHFLLDGGRI
ncbi:hypothetical protein AVEN_22522-1 [Araneus ventricosus]|uniref:Uncharacterized protein n=1 Tax=Araneus ventricosus TaxID=182803 RepID=A0A4Y2VKT8_ARAVE|nr:hypothetical protein AVEN_22522-1 [Araneus ventricosus]